MNPSPTSLTQLAVSAILLVWGLVPLGVSERFATNLKSERKNQADLDRMEQGYYEQLLDAGRRLDDRSGPPPRHERIPFKDGPLAVHVADMRECVLKPNLVSEHQGASWTTNALGLRDRPYPLEKPPETFRIVLIGDSIGVGWGVDDGDGFEPRLEQALDQRSRSAGGPAVEILNLSVPGYAPGQRAEHLARLGWSLEPDLILYEATEADIGWDERRLRKLLPLGIGWDEPRYQTLLRQIGIQPGDDPATIETAIRARRWDLVDRVYQQLADDARSQGVPVVWVLVPRVGRRMAPADQQRLIDLAERAGFDVVLDLVDTFDGLDPSDLAIAPDDYHPNADGHARLARQLDDALAESPGVVPLGPWQRNGKGDPRR